MFRPKKNSYKEYDNEKKFLRLKNSPPPHNFSNGPSLNMIPPRVLKMIPKSVLPQHHRITKRKTTFVKREHWGAEEK